MNTKVWCIITYDIRNPRRLVKVFRELRKQTLAMHESVFLFQGNKAELNKLEVKLKTLIKPNKDDVYLYRLPKNPHFYYLGVNWLPVGVVCNMFPTLIPWKP